MTKLKKPLPTAADLERNLEEFKHLSKDWHRWETIMFLFLIIGMSSAFIVIVTSHLNLKYSVIGLAVSAVCLVASVLIQVVKLRTNK